MIQVYEGNGERPALPPVSRAFDYDRLAGRSGSFMLAGREFTYRIEPTTDGEEEWLDIHEVVGETEPRPVMQREAGELRADRRVTNPVYDANGIATRYMFSLDLTVGAIADIVRHEAKV